MVVESLYVAVTVGAIKVSPTVYFVIALLAIVILSSFFTNGSSLVCPQLNKLVKEIKRDIPKTSLALFFILILLYIIYLIIFIVSIILDTCRLNDIIFV